MLYFDAEDFVKDRVVVRHDVAVDPAIPINDFVPCALFGGIEIAVVVAGGKPVLEVKPRPEKNNVGGD